MMTRTVNWPCIVAALVGVIAVLALPQQLEVYSLINCTIYVSMAIFALSMALIWGYGGVLCFGQSAYFGLGAYAYAVVGINCSDSTFGVMAAVIIPALFAALLGYFVFYGRLTDVYFGVITLTVTLILSKLANSTAGDAYRIGKARLGGFNGMPDTPPLNIPFHPDLILTPAQAFAVATSALVVGYIICKWLVFTRYGRSVIAVRENEVRAELLGYDARLIKLSVFVIGAVIAGIAGALFASTVFVSPTVFSLNNAAQVLIWVVVGGIGTLMGPLIASVLLQALATYLGKLGLLDPSVVLGMILIAFVLLVPRGLLPLLIDATARVKAQFTTRSEQPEGEVLHE